MAAGLLFSLALGSLASAQVRPMGTIVVPQSSIAKPGDAGRRAHTNVRYFVPEGGFKSPQPLAKGQPPFAGYFWETPASLGCIYNLATTSPGCDPNVITSANPTGGANAIAIVDAYDDPYAVSDLQYFSSQFGLPKPNIVVVYATGTYPGLDPTGGWELEESLDIEWAHAMAPKATIYLVEANSSGLFDLFVAEEVAANLVAAAGGGEVSNSWGSDESDNETEYDSVFTTPGVVYFAAAGDTEGTSWPSTSPNVVSVGGTSISRDPLTGYFQEEYAWNIAGSGPSTVETRPSFQNDVQNIVGSSRGTPDVAAVADPSSGVWVYLTFNRKSNWFVVGGTSVATPVWAGIVNSAGTFASSSQAELTNIYGNLGVPGDFNDITLGACYFYNGYLAVKGYDFCTGVGTPNGKTGK
jgi:subtilase family serine protease